MVKDFAVAAMAHYVHILLSLCLPVVLWTYLCYRSGMKSERLVIQVEPKLKEALEQYSKTSGVLAGIALLTGCVKEDKYEVLSATRQTQKTATAILPSSN